MTLNELLESGTKTRTLDEFKQILLTFDDELREQAYVLANEIARTITPMKVNSFIVICAVQALAAHAQIAEYIPASLVKVAIETVGAWLNEQDNNLVPTYLDDPSTLN